MNNKIDCQSEVPDERQPQNQHITASLSGNITNTSRPRSAFYVRDLPYGLLNTIFDAGNDRKIRYRSIQQLIRRKWRFDLLVLWRIHPSVLCLQSPWFQIESTSSLLLL